MEPRTIRLRYKANCARCGRALVVSTYASWDAETRTVTCLDCAQRATTAAQPTNAPVPSATETSPHHPPTRSSGGAGASARREYERRHQQREARIEQRWGRLAGVAKFLSDDPQSTRAWATGSEGERRLAATLAKRVGDRAVLLHDRKVPKTRGNIDHLAIAPSGVWVIDAKTYKGLVERRDKGGWFKHDYRLYVNGRDRTKLVHTLGWQVDAVQNALAGDDVPVNAALCFIDAEWKRFSKPIRLDDVWVTWGKKLAEMIASPGPLTQADVLRVSDQLAAALPPST